MLGSRLAGGTGRDRPVGDRPRLGAPWSGGNGTSQEPEECAGERVIGALLGAVLCLGVDLPGPSFPA